MRFSSPPSRHPVQFLLALWIALLAIPALAATPSPEVVRGTQWLSAQVAAEGSVATESQVATPTQSTAETLRLWHLTGDSDSAQAAAAYQYLESTADEGTEWLARRIVASIESGTDHHLALVTELLDYANTDGGFGSGLGFQSTSLDTAFALEALSIAGLGQSNTVLGAVEFLLNRQNPEGGWSIGINASDSYITAHALIALLPFSISHPGVTAAISKARSAIISMREDSSLWGEEFRSAMALIALAKSASDTTPLKTDIATLAVAQTLDGSWSSDAFATALALRLAVMGQQPILNPNLGAIAGRVVDGDSGIPLRGVSVKLAGPGVLEITTDSTGAFLFRGLSPGDYQLAISPADYGSLITFTRVVADRNTELGDLALLRQSANLTTATLQGAATDAVSGLPLEGVVITAGAVETLTGPDGRYQLNSVTPGLVLATARLPGYVDQSIQVHLTSGSTLIFSPTMSPGSILGSEAAVYGTILDATTRTPLPGVAVTVSGSTTLATTTDQSG